ncbi:hypothetical protein D3C73_764870 [compost metagenome]
MSAVLEQRLLAFSLEARVAHRDQFIDQIAVELDRQRQAERQARTHARRIMLDRVAQSRAQLGEIIHACQGVLIVAAVEARQEPDVVQARQAALKTAGEADGPG